MIFTKEQSDRMAAEALGDHASGIDSHVLAYLIGMSNINDFGRLLTPKVTYRGMREGTDFNTVQVKEAVKRLEGMRLLVNYYEDDRAHSLRFYVLPRERFSYDELFPEEQEEQKPELPETVRPPEKVYVVEDVSGMLATSEFYTNPLVATLAASILNSAHEIYDTGDGDNFFVTELRISENEKRLLDER